MAMLFPARGVDHGSVTIIKLNLNDKNLANFVLEANFLSCEVLIQMTIHRTVFEKACRLSVRVAVLVASPLLGHLE